MKIHQTLLALAAAFVLSAPALAADAPAGSTGQCKDGTYTTAVKKKGACSDHGGVKAWYGQNGAKEGAAKSKSSKSKSKDAAHGSASDKGAGSTSMSGPTARGEMPSARSEMPASQPAPAKSETRASKAEMRSGKSEMAGTSKSRSSSMAAGAGQVWVNKPTKVYHCPGDRWYGKTKDGAYMSESEAKAAGYRPDHGKDCASR